VLAALLLLLLVVWLWPTSPEPLPPPPPEPPPAPVVVKPVVKKKPAPKKPAPPPPAPESQRALLRKAVEARAPDLRACTLPPGAPRTLGTKIRVAQKGATRGVSFSTPQPLPRQLSECLRQRILAWEFSDVGLRSDVEIFVSFTLGT
jgi:outer membrane biosynthesis protein TonB